MSVSKVSYCLVFLCIMSTLSPRSLGAEEEAIGAQVARAAGSAAWGEVARVSFTWHHIKKGFERSYVWEVKAHRVTAKLGEGREVTVDLDDPSQRESEGYKAFINDSYWALFPLHLQWDTGVKVSRLEAEGLPDGVMRVQVAYGAVGPTPGDVYWLDVDARTLRDRGWTYNRGGVSSTPLVTTREAHVTQKGITVATKFAAPDGEVLIRIEGLKIE